MFNFAVSLLAGFGVDRLFKGKVKLSSKIAIFLPTVILFGSLLYVVGSLFFDSQEEEKLIVALRNLVLPFVSLISSSVLIFLFQKRAVPRLVLAGGIFLILLGELFYFGWKFVTFSPRHIVYPQTPVLNPKKGGKKLIIR